VVIAEKNNEIVKLDNGILLVRFNLKEGVFSAWRGKRRFLKEGRFEKGPAITFRIVKLKDALGVAKAIEVKYPSGCIYTLALYEKLPFICIKTAIHNSKSDSLTLDKITSLSIIVDLGVPANNLRTLGCDGLNSANKPRTSYVFLAVSNPRTRAGAVCGWLTDNQASGTISSRKRNNIIAIEGHLEYGKFSLKKGENTKGEMLAIGYFEDILEGLEVYADAIAKTNNIKLPKQPSGYCTWYHARALDEKRMAKLADFCSKNLCQYGLEFLQIDDGWQISERDYTTYDPNGPYPNGMKEIAKIINSHGFKAGLWLIPFGWDSKRLIFSEHQDWFVKREDGSVYSVYWGGDCLDMSHPEARKFLRKIIKQITKEWGYKYLKIDGLWTGMATKILYPEPTYREDGLGDAIFYDSSKSNVEVYREGLKLVREAAGENVFILGCTIAQNMRTFGASFGLVDAMRIGPDIDASWKSILVSVKIGAHLYFLNGKVWYNDPDCLMLRAPLTLDQARAWGSWIAISGQMNVVSEWLPELPLEKLNVVKRTIPSHQKLARPVDLFESPIPRIWHLQAGEGKERRDIIGLFNWDAENEVQINVNLAKLNLPSSKNDQYVGFDFWEDEFVPPFAGVLKSSLRPSSCRIIAIRQLLDHPQIVSTSRHVTQGLIDIIEERWDKKKNVLSGRSKIVGGDPYELRIITPSGADVWRAVSASVSEEDQKSGVTVGIKQIRSEVRVRIKSRESREVSWSVAFKKI